MRLNELIIEGGWETTATQGTVITPSVVKQAVDVMSRQFIPAFNRYLKQNSIEPIEMGHTTGSSAHYKTDPEDTIYGDIDLQVIVPPVEGKNTSGERQSFWGSMIEKFMKANSSASYIDPSSLVIGKPIISLGQGKSVQIDVMPHTKDLSVWGRFRATAERGVKGLLNGNLFSVLSTIFDYNLQHSGIQYKTVDGQKADYTKTRKGYELVTVGTNVHTFVMDIFKDQVRAIQPTNVVIDPLLREYQGVQKVDDVENLRVSYLVNAIKGLARSFEKSGMYGKGDLAPFANEQEFIQEFIRLYMEKANYAITNKKFDKAIDPAAIARAQRDKENIEQGANYVKSLFSSELHMPRYLDWRVKNKTA
jgi:hypothetical protein